MSLRTPSLPLLALVGLLASGCHGPTVRDGAREPLMVFAAASLRDVVADLAAEFENRHAVEVVFNFAGSNTLAQQIRAAPSADVFLSADGAWMDFLDDAGRTMDGTRRPFLTNRLVVVAHREAPCRVTRPSDLVHADYRHLALGDPLGVPAGRYARAFLEREPFDEDGHDNLWSALSDRVVPTVDVRAALALVESDPEILGIVYKTDALSSPRVRVLYELESGDGLGVIYWAALIEGGESPRQGLSFLDFLESPAARKIAESHGFGSLPQPSASGDRK